MSSLSFCPFETKEEKKKKHILKYLKVGKRGK